MVGVGILIALAFISTGVAIFFVVRDTVKNITYEEVDVFEDEDYDDEEIMEEEVDDDTCHLTLVPKTNKYDYVYKEEVLEKPKLEIVSGYSRKRIK